MKRGLRRLLLAVVGAAALFVTAALVLPLLIDVDRFRPGIEAALSSVLGRPVSVGPLRLSLWTGVAVRTDRVEVGAPPGREVATLLAGPVRLRPALLPLLSGTVDLRGIVAEAVGVARAGRPILRGGGLRARLRRTGSGDVDLSATLRGTWVALPGAPTGPISMEGEKRGTGLRLRRLQVELGPTHLDLRGRAEGVGTGTSRWAVQGSGGGAGSQGKGEVALALTPAGARLDFALDFERVDFAELAALAAWASAGTTAAAPAPGPQGQGAPLWGHLQGQGRLRAKAARLAGLDLEDVATTVALGGGRATLQQATFGLYGGRHRGSLTLDAGADGAPFRLASRVEGVDAARLLTALSPGSAGVFRGTAALDLDLAGVAHAPEVLPTLGGTMRLQVRDGALTTVGLLETVAVLLEAAGGRGIGREETPFRTLQGTFALAAGVAHTEDLAIVADDLRLDVRGNVDLRGPLALQGVVAFSPEVSASMIRETSALRIRQGEDGRLTVPLAFEGTFSSPRVKVDVQRILREGLREETRRSLEQKVEKTRKKLLDRLLR